MTGRSVFSRFWFIPLLALLALTGCSVSDTPIDENTTGWFNHYFVYSFSRLIGFTAELFHGNYGLAIILVTLLIRFALMPLMLRQSKKQAALQGKMRGLQPELQALKEKYRDKEKDPAFQGEMQKEMLALYSKHQVNPLAVGCLPLLLQIPILTGFYYAIRRTPEIAEHSFLWFNLGHTDLVLPLLAAAVYYVQFRLSQRGMAPEQAKQTAVLGLLSPVMMGLFSFSAPAAMPLYWVVGGCFLIFQTWLAKRLYPVPSTVE